MKLHSKIISLCACAIMTVLAGCDWCGCCKKDQSNTVTTKKSTKTIEPTTPEKTTNVIPADTTTQAKSSDLVLEPKINTPKEPAMPEMAPKTIEPNPEVDHMLPTPTPKIPEMPKLNPAEPFTPKTLEYPAEPKTAAIEEK